MTKYSKVATLLEIYITVNPDGLFSYSRLLRMGKQVHLTC